MHPFSVSETLIKGVNKLAKEKNMISASGMCIVCGRQFIFDEKWDCCKVPDYTYEEFIEVTPDIGRLKLSSGFMDFWYDYRTGDPMTPE